MGTITTAASMDTDLWNEMEKLRKMDGASRSYWIQSALRMKNNSYKKQNITQYLDELDDDELDLLKNEIKKRG